MTADENENQARELRFGTSINFIVYIKIPIGFFSYQLSSAVNSCQQLIKVDEIKNQPSIPRKNKKLHVLKMLKLHL